MRDDPTLFSDDTITRLYPSLSAEERRLAAANLRRYVEVILRIVEREEADPGASLTPPQANE
jgi:hypothetical protein